jgi:hypothetical protein
LVALDLLLLFLLNSLGFSLLSSLGLAGSLGILSLHFRSPREKCSLETKMLEKEGVCTQLTYLAHECYDALCTSLAVC